MPPEYELLDTRPQLERDPRVTVLVVLVLLVVSALLVGDRLRDDEPPAEDCRRLPGAVWCTTPSEAMADPGVVRLVRGYCPRLRSVPLAQVVPQPLTRVGLPARRGELVLRTSNAGAQVETGLLGRAGHLAWVLRRADPGKPSTLEMVCHEGEDQVPALELNPDQLRSALRADAGEEGLDLRLAAIRAARAVRTSVGSRVSLGTFRCRTGPQDLALQQGARFGCSLRLYSDQGQALQHLTYGVALRAPYLRLMA